jgi:hypothetical protein
VSSYLPFQQSFVVKQIALHMDSKFYHFNIDIDIPQAKIFCSPLTFARGHSDLAGGGGHGPLWPPLATGLDWSLLAAASRCGECTKGLTMSV